MSADARLLEEKTAQVAAIGRVPLVDQVAKLQSQFDAAQERLDADFAACLMGYGYSAKLDELKSQWVISPDSKFDDMVGCLEELMGDFAATAYGRKISFLGQGEEIPRMIYRLRQQGPNLIWSPTAVIASKNFYSLVSKRPALLKQMDILIKLKAQLDLKKRKLVGSLPTMQLRDICQREQREIEGLRRKLAEKEWHLREAEMELVRRDAPARQKRFMGARKDGVIPAFDALWNACRNLLLEVFKLTYPRSAIAAEPPMPTMGPGEAGWAEARDLKIEKLADRELGWGVRGYFQFSRGKGLVSYEPRVGGADQSYYSAADWDYSTDDSYCSAADLYDATRALRNYYQESSTAPNLRRLARYKDVFTYLYRNRGTSAPLMNLLLAMKAGEGSASNHCQGHGSAVVLSVFAHEKDCLARGLGRDAQRSRL